MATAPIKPIRFTSSGTTGKPKAYTLTAAQIAARVADMARVRPPGWANLTSIYNDYAARPGVQRDTAWMAEKGGKLFRPLATFEATVQQFIDNNIQGIFGPAPGLARFAAALEKSSYRPQMVVSSTAVLTAALSKTIQAGMGPNLWTVYSVGECGTIAMATAAQAEAVPGCVGKPIAGVQVQIVAGEIQVKTPIMIAKYDNPADTTKLIVNGWLLTGDKGSLAADGTLIYEGRM